MLQTSLYSKKNLFCLDTGIEISNTPIIHVKIFKDPPFLPSKFHKTPSLWLKFSRIFFRDVHLNNEHSLTTVLIERIGSLSNNVYFKISWFLLEILSFLCIFKLIRRNWWDFSYDVIKMALWIDRYMFILPPAWYERGEEGPHHL